MEKIQFTDPDTNEVVEFAVEEQTQLNGIRYLLVSDGNENGEWTASATLIARISCSVMSTSSLQTIIPTGIGSCRIGNPVPEKRMH